MQEKLYLNKKWMFTDSFSGILLIEAMKDGQMVDLPHTSKEASFNYVNPGDIRRRCIYQRVFTAKEEWRGKRMILTFEGVAWKAGVFINGVNVITHQSHSAPFHIDIETKVHFGKENLITVVVDSEEDMLNQPPFNKGAPVDEIPFCGIYREVYITIKDKISMNGCFYKPATILPPDTKGLTRKTLQKYTIQGKIETEISLSESAIKMAKDHRLYVRQYLNDKEISYQPLGPNGETSTLAGQVNIWDIDSPTCYRIQTDLLLDDMIIDTDVSTIGFRSAVFDQSGFYLNGRKVKLRGVVRYQSYPYVGFAMPESIQRFDAKILKEELHVNAVRCYGGYHSDYFLKECDSRGILVFLEVPGYRYLGNSEFNTTHLQNVKEMIIAGRNHPSVFLWGVRINGAPVSDLDKQSVSLAHSLDSTRATSGERLEKSNNFYEDVYAYTDFSYNGKGSPLLSKAEVTSDMGRPYLISGFCGESFPVKSTDSNKRNCEHAIRTAAVLDAIGFSEDICGSFIYSMSDHQSMAEYAAEDGIAYHGLLDSFRNKKVAANIYSVQNNPNPEISVFPSLGGDRERWEGFGDVYMISNTDKIRVFRDGSFVGEYQSSDTHFSHMRHGPILLEDFLGEIFSEDGDIRQDQAKRLKKLLNQMAIGGLSSFLQPGQIGDRIMGKIIYRMNRRQLLDLYENYVSKSHEYRFDGVNGEDVVVSTTLSYGDKKYLKVDTSSINLIERYTYDVVAVRIKVTNASGEPLRDYCEPVMIETKGPIKRIGPTVIPLRGGMCGTYVRSIGKEGTAVLKVSCGNLAESVVNLTVLKAPHNEI